MERQEHYKQRALAIIKYQNFEVPVALKRCGIKIGRAVFDAGVAYVKRGKVTTPLSDGLKKELDKLKAEFVQPLRPSRADEKQWRKPIYVQKEATPPVCNNPIIKKQVASVFDYGVLVGNTIRILDTEKEAKIFLEGIKFAGGNGTCIEVEKRELN